MAQVGARPIDEIEADLEDAFDAKDLIKVNKLNEELRGAQAALEDDVAEPGDTPQERVKFPIEVLPSIERKYAIDVARSTENPVDAVGFIVFGVAIACFGTHIRFRRHASHMKYCNDFLAYVAGPSIGKSPPFGLTSTPLYRIQDALQEDAAPAVRAAKAKIVALETKKSALKKVHKVKDCDESLAGDLEKLDAEIEELVKVRLPKITISDVTPEAFVMLLSQNDDVLSMATPEGPVFSNMCKGTAPPVIKPFLSAYDGERVEIDRVTREENIVKRGRLSIIVGTQPSVMEGIRSRPELIHEGFVPRFTFLHVDQRSEDDLVDEPVEVSDEDQHRYCTRLAKLGLRFRLQEWEPFKLDDDALERYNEWRNVFKRREFGKGDLADIAPFARKLEEKVLRWAGVLHVLWSVDPLNDGSGDIEITIGVDDIDRAISLVDFAIGNYRAVTNLIEEGPVKTLARALAKHFAGMRGQSVKRNKLTRLFTPYRKADQEVREAALVELEERGVIRVEQIPTKGRPSIVIEVL